MESNEKGVKSNEKGSTKGTRIYRIYRHGQDRKREILTLLLTLTAWSGVWESKTESGTEANEISPIEGFSEDVRSIVF